MVDLPRAILFDWDNTLVESWGVIHEAMNRALDAMGHAPWSREETERRARASLRDSFPLLFGERWQEAEKVFYDSYAAIHLQYLRPIAGAEELLQHLLSIDGLYLGVVSNKRGPFLRQEAEHLGWSHYFHKIAGAGDAIRDKPAIEHVCLALGDIVAGPDVWFVGDTELDLICARNAGCSPILLRPAPPRAGEFPGHEPDLHFSDCSGLLAYLRRS